MYQALYRKWRPRTFDDVVGQDHITRTLRKQVCEGTLSHAYLFVGTRGTGKTSCAKILSKAVNCLNPQNGNPCNCCSACVGIDNGSITDVVEMDAASNNGVDDVRALRDEAVFTPAQVKKRVYIVDEVHMLSTSAFNALLKIIEEPPEHLMFILATTDVQKVPATILSRCQRYSFKRLDVPSITGRLQYIAGQENIALTQQGAGLIARLSEGGMRDAVSLLDQCSGYGEVNEDTVNSVLGLAGHSGVMKLCRAIALHDVGQSLELFSEMWTDGKDPASLLSELSALYREIMVYMEAPEAEKLLSGSYSPAELKELSSGMTAAEVVSHLEQIRACLASVRTGSAKLGCEICLVSLCREELSDSLSSLRSRVAALENSLRSGSFSVPVAAEKKQPVFSKETEDIIKPVTVKAEIPAPVPAEQLAPSNSAPSSAPVQEEPVPEPPSASENAFPVSGNVPAGSELQVLRAALTEKLPKGMSAIISSAQAELNYDEGTLYVRFLNKFASVMLGQADSKSRMEKICSDALGKKTVVRVLDETASVPQKKQAVSAMEKKDEPVRTVPAADALDKEKTADNAEIPESAGAKPDAQPVEKSKEDKLDYLHKFDIVKFI